MNFIGISINHRTSPIEIREALHLSREEQIDFISILKESLLSEGFILSTCNRTEIFGIPKNLKITHKSIIEELINFKNISNLETEYYETFNSKDSIVHIAKVASGIDSLIIGDSQILSQCKDGFQLSEETNFSGTVLHKIAETAIRVGKRSIKETSISLGAVTVSYAAIQVIEKIFANLSKKSALIIGAGETSELAALNLKGKGIGKISISNRTLQKAENLARKVSGSVINFQEFKDHLYKFDIIISATSSQNYLVSFDDIKKAISLRKGNPIFLMDIAIPRDIDPNVKKIDNVFYNDIDSLNIIVDQNLDKRKSQIPFVEKIIEEEVTEFYSWYHTLGIVPTIKSLRSFFETIELDELNKIKNKVTSEDYLKLEDMAKRLIGRILHNPIIKLREIAEKDNNSTTSNQYTSVIKELFDLDNFPTNGRKEGQE